MKIPLEYVDVDLPVGGPLDRLAFSATAAEAVGYVGGALGIDEIRCLHENAPRYLGQF